MSAFLGMLLASAMSGSGNQNANNNSGSSGIKGSSF